MTDTIEQHCKMLASLHKDLDIGDPRHSSIDAAITALSARASAGEGGPSCPAIDADNPTDPDSKRLAALADWMDILAPGRSLSARTYLLELSRRLAAPQPAQAGASGGGGLTFGVFRAANVARCIKWHPEGIASWSPSDWLTAVTGELGELASLLKMRNRERDGLAGNKFSPTDKMVADELADVLTYLDLLAEVLGVDLGRAAVDKFNEVSERVGFPDRITLTTPASPATGDAATWEEEIRRHDATPQSAAAQGQWLVELVAKAIYSQWTFMPGYVEWVERGNSIRQDDARELARAHIAAAPQPQEDEKARRPCPRCDTCNDLIVIGYCRDCAHTMADAAEATPPAHGDGEGDDPFGDMPAPIGNPEAWPPNYADGYNDAVRNMVDSFPSVRARLTTRPTPEAQEARDAARYRWLRQFDIGIDHQGYDDYRWYAYAKPEPRNGRLGLDAAIDAALALPAQGEGNNG